jgi:uncharacterized membrane protein (UPF0182 family)
MEELVESQLRPTGRGRLLTPIGVAVLAIIVILAVVSGAIQKWLWMRQLDFAGIFWTLLAVKWQMFCSAFVVAFLYLWINLRLAVKKGTLPHQGRPTGLYDILSRSGIGASPASLKVAVTVVSVVVGLFIALVFYGQWDTYLRFRHGGSFGLSDPLFGVDVGFYLFRLPFYELLQNSLTGLTLVTLLCVLLAYAYFGRLQLSNRGTLKLRGAGLSHLSALLFFLVASWAWGFYLDHFELLYSNLGVVHGAGYTADHVTSTALWVMVGAAAVLCVLLALNVFRPGSRAPVVGLGLFLALYVIGVVLLPPMFQRFMVQPNELALESPYLKNNIELTREAYKLNAIQETAYPALSDLTPEKIARNQDTIQNVRLWDWRLLLQTYRQTQEIRLYYQFYKVDVDRYHLADGYHQVMLSARELSPELPAKAQTWVNQYLQFTHGYGVVMSFVSKVVGEGFPQFLIENIPPESHYDLPLTQPGVYYGETMPGYRIVGTRVKELDYPKGDQNVYTSYQGKGGIPLDSFWKRLLFAWTQSDVNILLTSYLQPESRIQIWRQVQERVGQIAPFLQLDRDPYAVLSEGKLYWIQDAYTVSNRFPYATPYTDEYGRSLNYIRNSVKVVVDMYDGTVRFYVMDPADPVLSVYRRAFPGVFKDLSQLSGDLKQHLRYPEDLFSIQADLYRTFHMTPPQVFYNQEDLWMLPQQKYAGTALPMVPYYILMKLPGSDKLQYLLMEPFTPQNRDNMVAWMAARCDSPGYGKILVYRLPKDKLVLGPMQIEAMIDQNTTISGQLSLWDQKGSQVTRGNLLVIPIEDSFLYVEPVYLTAEGTNIPQLKRIIVVSGDKVVMERTLDGALAALFGGQQPQATAVPAPGGQPEMAQARKQLDQAQKAIQQGDWGKFGKEMDALKRLLNEPSQ